jgi:hypothetical protein
MKILRQKNNALVIEEVPLNTTTAIARAISARPELVKTQIHQVINDSDFRGLLKSLPKIARPFAIAVITSAVEVR